MKFSELLKLNGFTLERAAMVCLLYELSEKGLDEEALYKKLSELQWKIPNANNILLFLEEEGYITIDALYGQVILRAPLLKLFEPAGDEVVEIIEYLNKVTGRKFNTKSNANRKFIKARLKDGYTVQDCKGVINTMNMKWGRDGKMRVYLRPETLFNETKFQTYYALYLEYKQTSDEGDWTLEKA